MKICSVCNIEKELTEFCSHKKNKDGLNTYCNLCKSIKSKNYYLDNKVKVKGRVSDYRMENLEIVSDRVRNYYNSNKEEILNYKKEYWKNNKEKESKRNKEYYEENKKEIHRKSYIYMKELRKTNPIFKLKERISGLVYRSIKNQGYKKIYQTEIILGCSIFDFREYLEGKFTEGMTWENQGEWHLDHIRPVSWGKTEEEVYELNHYTNFQPLWQKDNLSKGNRWEG